MPIELRWMTLTVLMTAIFWLPYVLDRVAVRGVRAWLLDRAPETGERHSLWAKRAIRAHANAVENLVIFVPAVLAAVFIHLSTPATHLAAETYFFARLTHFIVQVLAVPVVRTLAFTVGWLCQIVILASVLGWL